MKKKKERKKGRREIKEKEKTRKGGKKQWLDRRNK